MYINLLDSSLLFIIHFIGPTFTFVDNQRSADDLFKINGFRKNSIFSNRLTAATHDLNLELFTFFSVRINCNMMFFGELSSVLEELFYER